MRWWFLTSDSIVYKHFTGIANNCSTGILMWSSECECYVTIRQRWTGTSIFLQAGCNWQFSRNMINGEARPFRTMCIHCTQCNIWHGLVGIYFLLAIHYLVTYSSSYFINILRTCFSDYTNDHAIAREVTLQWRHNECDGVSNHQPHNCLINCLFRHRTK